MDFFEIILFFIFILFPVIQAVFKRLTKFNQEQAEQSTGQQAQRTSEGASIEPKKYRKSRTAGRTITFGKKIPTQQKKTTIDIDDTYIGADEYLHKDQHGPDKTAKKTQSGKRKKKYTHVETTLGDVNNLDLPTPTNQKYENVHTIDEDSMLDSPMGEGFEGASSRGAKLHSEGSGLDNLLTTYSTEQLLVVIPAFMERYHDPIDE